MDYGSSCEGHSTRRWSIYQVLIIRCSICWGRILAYFLNDPFKIKMREMRSCSSHSYCCKTSTWALVEFEQQQNKTKTPKDNWNSWLISDEYNPSDCTEAQYHSSRVFLLTFRKCLQVCVVLITGEKMNSSSKALTSGSIYTTDLTNIFPLQE